MNAIVPIPRCSIAIRPATMADIPFMDRLQKKYGKALGYFPTKQFEGYVESGGVLIAESVIGHSSLVTCQGERSGSSCPPSLTSDKGPVTSDKLGYIIS